MTVEGGVSFTLTQPFTHPECVHLNGNPAPGLGTWSGSGLQRRVHAAAVRPGGQPSRLRDSGSSALGP